MDAAYEVLTTGARRTERGFREPDDDWFPMWLVLTQRQGALITGNAEKRDMAEYVGRWARRVGAVCIAHLHSSWLVHSEDVGLERMRQLHQQMLDRDGSTEGIAERREIVLLAVYSAGTARQYHAAIHRHSDAPPTLGAFELIDDTATSGDARVEGAMVDPLVEALVRVG